MGEGVHEDRIMASNYSEKIKCRVDLTPQRVNETVFLRDPALQMITALLN